MGLFRGTVRWLGKPYIEAYKSVKRVGTATKDLRAAMRDNRQAEDAVERAALKAAKPVDTAERFAWYCEQWGIDEDAILFRLFWFEFSRKVCLVSVLCCFVVGLPMSFWLSRLAGLADLMAGVSFLLAGCRYAYFLHQLRNRRIVTIREFLSSPTLFSEWLKWRP
jgi:hypothetical protein